MMRLLVDLRSGLKRRLMILMAVSTLVLLAAVALAAEETVTLDEYEVSFDLGNYTGYEIDFEEVPYATVDGKEHPSHVCWIGEGRTMMIAITDYGVPMEATSSLTRRAVVSYLNDAGCANIQTHEVYIDAKPAILGLGGRQSGRTLVCAIFWPDIREVNGTLYGQVDCTIASEASVELTEMLINSVQVKLPGEVDEVPIMEARSEWDRIEL
ncbi:hypothetical protein [Methanocrinis sp.]|uniref:hypothetical protein n=1 Tax=Methanocrinis sp. TaxID=3101522 RepID=UPI003D0CE217